MTPIRIELPTPFAVGPVNAYLFTEPEPVLVDTGVDSDESWVVLQAGLADHGLSPADLQRIVITHAHVDHFGAAARLAAHSQAQIWIADLGVDWLLSPERKWDKRIAFYREHFLPFCDLSEQAQAQVITYMVFAAKNSQAVSPDRLQTFAPGDRLTMGGLSWEVLHMPGHASHQTCFYQPETQQLVSADMVLHIAPTPVVEAPPDGRVRVPALPIFMESLKRVEALALKNVYPGHGRVITDPYPLIQKQRARIHQRKEEALTLIKQGHTTVSALVSIMYAHYPESARFAGLWMLIGYLDLLKAEQAIEERIIDGVWHYFITED